MLVFLLRRRAFEAGGRVARIGLYYTLLQDCSVFQSSRLGGCWGR